MRINKVLIMFFLLAGALYCFPQETSPQSASDKRSVAAGAKLPLSQAPAEPGKPQPGTTRQRFIIAAPDPNQTANNHTVADSSVMNQKRQNSNGNLVK